MDSTLIRKAIVTDAEAIAHIIYDEWAKTYRGIVSDKYLESINKDELISAWHKMLSSENREKITDVMQNEKREVIGYIFYGKNYNENINADAEIFELYLLSEYHRKGFGSQLFEHCISQLRAMNMRSLYVSLFKQNSALHFYRKFKPSIEVIEIARAGEMEYEGLGLIWSDMTQQ